MYLKLTKLDGASVWINAAFVVTVEPRKGGGAIVVPVGDGLDYEVREPPESVLALLEAAPVVPVVPVPASDALAPAPSDVSPEPEPSPSPAAEVKPSRRQPAAAKARAARPASRRKASASTSKPAQFGDDELERLRTMRPGSVKKLQNTLSRQFNVADADAVVKSLVERGVLEIVEERVVWRQPSEDR